jgi:four helix bundle protein
MATFAKFEDMEAWQKSRSLCQKLYMITGRENFSRDFKLRNQVNSSSGSMMDNIAEGFDRGSTAEFIYFLGIAKGSAAELRSQFYRALDRNYISQEEFDTLYDEANTISKMIMGQIKYLKRIEMKGSRYKKENSKSNSPQQKTKNKKQETKNTKHQT